MTTAPRTCKLMFLLLMTMACLCLDSWAVEPSVPEGSRPPKIRVSRAGEASVYDVLGKDSGGTPRLVMVPLRKKGGVRPAAFPGYEVVTKCGTGYCVDGLRATSEPRTLVVEPRLSQDETEILGPDPEQSWVERGIKVTHVDQKFVSYLVASADFSAGAAHSNADLHCRTHPRRSAIATVGHRGKTSPAGAMKPADLAHVLGGREARALLDAVRKFIEDEELDGVEPLDPTEYLLEDDAVIFCLQHQTTGSRGFVEKIRAQLPK